MRFRLPLRGLVTLFALAALGGCAELLLTEVTDDNRGDLTGPRFYMNRPFVAVHKPFPLGSESYLVDAHVSADGKHLRITGDLAPLTSTSRLRHFRDALDLSSIPAAAVIAAPSVDGGAIGVQGTGPGINPLHADDKPDGRAKPGPDADAGVKTGMTNIQIRTELNSLPHFPVNEHFSILFLPDFDREMSIEATANAGIVRTSLKYGPGNMLLDLDADGDNSAVLGPIMDAYASLTKLGVQAAKAAMTAGGGIGVQGSTLAVAPTGSRLEVTDAARGQAITLRLHVVKFAAIGMYPIVRDADEVDRYTSHPAGEYIVPRAAYEIPYRYFEVIVIEALLSSDVPSLLTTYSESGQTYDGAPGGGGAGRGGGGAGGGGGGGGGVSSRSTTSPLLGSMTQITTKVNRSLLIQKLAVVSITTRTPDDDTKGLTSVSIKLKSTDDRPVDAVRCGDAKSHLEKTFKGTTFVLTG